MGGGSRCWIIVVSKYVGVYNVPTHVHGRYMLWHVHAHTQTHTYLVLHWEQGQLSTQHQIWTVLDQQLIDQSPLPTVIVWHRQTPPVSAPNKWREGWIFIPNMLFSINDRCMPECIQLFWGGTLPLQYPKLTSNSIHPCATNTCYKPLILVSFNFPVRCQAILKHEASEQGYVSTHHPCVCSHATIFWGHKWKVVNQNGTF